MSAKYVVVLIAAGLIAIYAAWRFPQSNDERDNYLQGPRSSWEMNIADLPLQKKYEVYLHAMKTRRPYPLEIGSLIVEDENFSLDFLYKNILADGVAKNVYANYQILIRYINANPGVSICSGSTPFDLVIRYFEADERVDTPRLRRACLSGPPSAAVG